MSTWKTASLGEIFEIARGGSPRPIQDYLTDDPNGVNWISISDASASSKLITATKKRIRPEGVSRSRMVKPGDFLLTNSMSFGRPYIMGTNGCIHDGWLVLSSKHDDVDQDYFFQLLSSDFIYAKFSKLAAGATVKNLNIDLVSGVEVTFPPLEEQRRIAAILDQAETLRTQRRTALALLDSLTQSLFLDMFGDPVANPKGWPTSPLADASDEIQIGPFGSLLHQEDYVPDGIPLINPMHIKEGQIVPGLDQCITQQKYDELSIYQLKVGDLVMGRRGEMGRCAIVTAEHGPLMCGTGSLYIRPNATIATATYLFHVLTSASMKAKLEEFSLGATMPNLNKGIVAGLRISPPPLPLQQTFATRIASIEALKATHRRALAALDALFASLQQRAFAGQL